MNTQLLIEFILPLSTALIGWFGNAYRSKQKKEKDTLDNIQQIITIQKGYIAEQQAELRTMRDEKKVQIEIIERKNKSIRQANKCKYTNEGKGCPVLNNEEKADEHCKDCKHNPDCKEHTDHSQDDNNKD